MKITTKQIKHLAKLSRLDLKPEEIKSYQKDLSAILGYVSNLQKLKLSKIKIKSAGNQDFLREDEVKKFSEPDSLIEQAHNRVDRFIKVKNVK